MALEFVGKGAETGFANQTSAGSETKTVTLPSGVHGDDLIVLVMSYYCTGSPDDGHGTTTVTTGTWDELIDDHSSLHIGAGSDNMKLTILTKVALAEPASYSVTLTWQAKNLFDPRACFLVYRNIAQPTAEQDSNARVVAGATLTTTLASLANPNGAPQQGLLYFFFGATSLAANDLSFATPAGLTLDASMDWDTGTGAAKNVRVYSQSWADAANFPQVSMVSTPTPTSPDSYAVGAVRTYALLATPQSPATLEIELGLLKVQFGELPYQVNMGMLQQGRDV